MLYGVYNLASGELDYVCDEEGRVNFDPEAFGFSEAPGWLWQETHVWNYETRTFDPIADE